MVLLASALTLHGQETWTDNDIGSVGAAGSSTYNSSTDTFTVNGAGSGIGGTSDNCHLVSTVVNGNVEIIANVASLQDTSASATSGLMIRDSTNANDISAYIAVTPSDGVIFITRSSTGGSSSTTTAAPSQAAPVWLRLVRNASTTPGSFILTGYYSTDGTSWTSVGTATIAMANSVLMGMAVSSNTTLSAAASTISNLDAMINVPQVTSNLVAWYRADAGVVQSSGAVSSWLDQSGNGNNVTQATSSYQPSFVASTLNGEPVVHFTHANNSYLSVANNATLDPTQITIFAVARNTGTTEGYLVGKTVIDGALDYILAYGTDTTPAFYINAPTHDASGTLSTGNWGMIEGDYDQNNISLYVNGTLTQTAFTTAISSSTVPMCLGGLSTAGYTLDGDMAEVLIFNTALSNIQRHQVESYLYQKYDVGTEPASPSPSPSIPQGIYSGSQAVTLTPGQPGDTIYYTTDGSTPTTSSNVYTGPITISSTTTLNIMEVGPGFTNSSVVSEIYTIDPTSTFTRTGLVAWLRADVGVTQGSGLVSQWNDQSGNGNNATQTTGAQQPTYVSSAVNGKPALQFNAADNSLLTIPNATDLNGAQLTILTVVKKTSSTTLALLVSKANSTSYPYALEYRGASTPELSLNSVTVTATGTLTNDTYGVVEGVYNQIDANLYVNGTLNESTAYTTALLATNTNPVSIGGEAGYYSLDGDIAEVLVFNTGLSDLLRHQVDAYLYARYGIGLEPPAPSPISNVPTGIYTGSQTVVLTPGQGGDVIYYTTDGSTPTTSSSIYTGSITVSSSETINAIEDQTNYAVSPVTSVAITIDPISTFTRTGLVAWLRADVGVTQGSGLVSQWNDQSGNGNNATQTTGAKQPAYVSSAVNGKPALQFNATGNTFLSIPNATYLNGTQLTVLTVVKKTSSTATALLVSKANATPYPYALEYRGASSPGLYLNSAAEAATGTLTNATYGVVEGVYNQTDASLYVNGTLNAATAYTTALVTTNTNAVSIGGETGSDSLDGDIAEVLVYNTGLSSADRENVENYLYYRYGLGQAPSPVITSATSANGMVGTSFSYAITASNSPTSYSLTGTIPGLGINTSTGVISGTPTTAGTYSVTIGATNARGTGTESLSVSINPSAPVIASATTATGTVGTAFSYTITATNSPTSYSLTGTIPGLGINATTGVISGTPTTAGTYSITIGAINSYGTGTTTLIITINPLPPLISSGTTATGAVGQAFSYTITGSNSPTSYSVTGLLPGLNLDTSTGVISGNPTAAGTYSVTIGATNAGGTGTGSLNVTINPQLPVITSGTTAAGTAGQPFTYTITATGAPTSYSASGLPSGLTINTTIGVISGTLASAGTSAVTLGATSAGGTGNATLTITSSNPSLPVITSGTAASGDVGVSFSYTILASNSPTSFIATGLPSGLTINTSTGVISGTPIATGTSSVTLGATNAAGTATATLALTVNGSTAPVITSALSGNIFTGTAFSYTITASNSPTGFTATGLPGGLTFNSGTGVISGTPTDTGYSTVSVSIGASNSEGTATATLILTLNLPLPIISSSTTASGSLGANFNYTISASNNPTTFSATGLPAGLSLNLDSGVISGTPTAIGTFAITIGATNAAGSVTTTLTLTIGSATPVPVIDSGTVATGSVGTAFSYSIATGTVPAPTSYGASGLPAGLSINTSTGVISGTPLTSSTTPSSVTLSATNSAGTGYATLMLTINPSGAPVITSTATAVGTAGSSFSYTVTANNSPTSFAASGLPTTLTLNPTTGQITGTPSTAGVFYVILSATNSTGTGSANLVLTVNPTAPVIGSATTASGTFGATITSPYIITASNNPTSFGATNLPPGLTVNAYTGAITGTPTMAGTWTVVLSATNAGGSGTADLTYTIAAGGSSPIATRSVATGDYDTLLLKSDGTVWATGFNYDGCLGNGGDAPSPSYVQVSGLSEIVAVASGGYTSMALDSSGHVWTWGANDSGELGSGSTAAYSTTPVEVSGLSGIIAITGGESFCMALDNSGHVWAWGYGGDGELGNSAMANSEVPVEVSNSTGYLSGITSIACEGYNGIAVRNDGTVWVWGIDSVDQLGDETSTNSDLAKEVSVGGNPLSGVVSVTGGEDYGFALTAAGTVWAWGDESEGYLGNGVTSGNTASPNTGPVQVLNSNGDVLGGVTSISSRGDHTTALFSNGTVWGWGQNSFGQLGNGTASEDSPSPVQVSNLTGIQAITAGSSHSMALKSDGTVWGWGYNEDVSEMGISGKATQTDLPATIASLSGITAIAGQKGHYLALTSSGTVWAWNDITPGEVGNGTTIIGSSTPVQVPGLNGVTITAIACGSYFNLALDNTGKVWAWGQNNDGQLGNGTNTDSQTPVQVMTSSGALSGISAISCTGYTGLALDSSGHVWTWGYDYDGELGNSDSSDDNPNAYVNTNLAAQVSSLSGITAISTGSYQVAALGSGGTVWLWGFDVASDGSFSAGGYTDTPVNIPSLSGVTAISVHANYDLALTSSGTLLGWGDNLDGELGNGTTTSNATFTAISGLTGVTAIGPGGDASHALALKSDGTLWEWGDNTSGQLGVGNYGPIGASPSPTGSAAPLQVLGLNGLTLTGFAFGKYSTVVLTSAGTVLQWGDNSYEPAGFSVPVQVADLQASPPPVISPAAGSYTSSQTISISTTLTGTIHYTVDGTSPTASSPVYSGSFTLSGDALVSAVVINGGVVVSQTVSSQYFINDSSQTGLPPAPTGLTVTPSSGQIDVSWTLSGADDYSLIGVYRSSDGGLTYQLVAILPSSATSYDDPNVQAGTSYQYYVATINDSGQSDTSASSSVNPTTPTPLTITLTTPSGATPLP